jgi:hypothetical protein
MQIPLLAAGVLMILIGVAHSAIGELLIFRQLRAGTIVPLLTPAPLRERHLRILWGSWHLCSVLGWGIAALLILIAGSQQLPAYAPHVQVIASTIFTGSMLVLYATRGRHPGWFGLLLAALLSWFGQSGV